MVDPGRAAAATQEREGHLGQGLRRKGRSGELRTVLEASSVIAENFLGLLRRLWSEEGP